jgi:ComF family protein
MKLAAAFGPLVDLIYPPRCPSCGDGITSQNGLCPACWGDLVIPGEPACRSCQRPFESEATTDGLICAPCLAAPPRHDGIAAGTLYNDASRTLVLAFKHGRRLALAEMLARMATARLPELAGPWQVIPVPLHRWRLWRRGFNQSALLAQEIARQLGQELVVDGLVRRKRTPSLGGLGRGARTRALSGAIAVNPRRRAGLQGANVILVDDVITSGATTNACVRTLKHAGAEKVMIACFARVLDEAL